VGAGFNRSGRGCCSGCICRRGRPGAGKSRRAGPAQILCLCFVAAHSAGVVGVQHSVGSAAAPAERAEGRGGAIGSALRWEAGKGSHVAAWLPCPSLSNTKNYPDGPKTRPAFVLPSYTALTGSSSSCTAGGLLAQRRCTCIAAARCRPPASCRPADVRASCRLLMRQLLCPAPLLPGCYRAVPHLCQWCGTGARCLAARSGPTCSAWAAGAGAGWQYRPRQGQLHHPLGAPAPIAAHPAPPLLRLLLCLPRLPPRLLLLLPPPRRQAPQLRRQRGGRCLSPPSWLLLPPGRDCGGDDEDIAAAQGWEDEGPSMSKSGGRSYTEKPSASVWDAPSTPCSFSTNSVLSCLPPEQAHSRAARGKPGGRKAQDWWGIAAREWQAGGGLGRSGGPGAGHAQLWTLLCPDSPTSTHLIYRPLGQRNPVHLPASPRCRNRAWRGRRRGRRHHCRRRWRRHGGRRLGRWRLGYRCVAWIVAL
jgi:hypothetical protein